MNVKKLSVHELLCLYSSIVEELRERNVIRTSNNPVADYAEYLVAQKMGLSLATSSTAGYDALNKKGIKYQIKSRRNTIHNNSKQLGVIRNLDEKKFDFLIGIIFNSNFNVIMAYQIPVDIISRYSRFSNHQNGYIFRLTGDVLNNKKVKNILSLFV